MRYERMESVRWREKSEVSPSAAAVVRTDPRPRSVRPGLQLLCPEQPELFFRATSVGLKLFGPLKLAHKDKDEAGSGTAVTTA
ncbi:hypothetical protein AOLI_G00172000 [Acnodon oligacanthus]